MFEAEGRAGGKLRSVSHDDLIWDGGANTMVILIVNNSWKCLHVEIILGTMSLYSDLLTIVMVATLTFKVVPCADSEWNRGPKSAW